MALDISKSFETTNITLGDEATGKATIIVGDFDPSSGAGQEANIGSLFIRDDGTIWQKTGATDTDWGGGVSLAEFVKKTGDTMTGTLTMDASGGVVEVLLNDGTTTWGLGFTSGGSPAIVRTGVGGFLQFFENAVNPQIIFGSNAAGTANTFLDCDNDGGMRLNTLHTGPVVCGPGGYQLDNGSLVWGLRWESGGSPEIYRNDVGGAMFFMKGAQNPQILFGDPAAALNTFLDTQNGGGMRLNTLQNGPVVIGSGGLLPEADGTVRLGDDSASARWGDADLSNTDIDGTILCSGVATIEGLGTGALADIDLYVGDAVTTPSYGMIKFGNGIIGRTNFNAGNLDLDGSLLLWNQGTPATSQIEFAFAESSNSIRFAIPRSGVGNATYNPRSLLIAGPAPLDDQMVTVGYWQTNNNIFDNLACDTATSGADLGVQNDLEVEGTIYTDEIEHSTAATDLTVAALTIESNGTLNVSSVTNYETLVTSDDDIPNKKYVDDNASSVVSLTTINGDLIPTFVDTGRSNKVLSTSEITYKFRENNVSNSDWINPGAADADSSFIARKNATIVGATGFTTSAPASKDIDLYINTTNNGSIGTFTSGTNQSFNVNTNIDISQGDRIRLRGASTGGQIEDTVIQLYVRWRG